MFLCFLDIDGGCVFVAISDIINHSLFTLMSSQIREESFFSHKSVLDLVFTVSFVQLVLGQIK